MLTRVLDDLGRFYVLDVHKDETVFLSEPTFSIPERKGKNGRMPTNIQPSIQQIQLHKYIKTITNEDFITENVRQIAKGWKVAKVHTVTVWHWNGKEEKARKRTMVITISEKTKFSLSGADKEEYTNK